MESLTRLQELYEDLTAFSEGRLAHVERLTQELESSIQDFQHLLDKTSQNNASRDTLVRGGLPEGLCDRKPANTYYQVRSRSTTRNTKSAQNFEKLPSKLRRRWILTNSRLQAWSSTGKNIRIRRPHL